MARDPSSEVSNAVRAVGRWTGGISRVIVVLKKEGGRASPLPKSARTVVEIDGSWNGVWAVCAKAQLVSHRVRFTRHSEYSATGRLNLHD